MPGTHPIETLALTLATHLPDRSLKSIREDLADDSARGLHLLARQLSTQREQRVVLVIDQFEELFTLTTSEAERRQFIDLIVAAVTEPAGPLIVVLTLRADFYDRLLMYAEAGQILQQHQYVVLPMEPYELRAVIERPAALPDVQLLFEDTLVGDLLYETQGQGGALPLLEFTLDFLFQCREGYWLTQQAYQRIGGVRGALAKHAEATYAALPSDDYRRLARVLFLRLIDPGQTEQDTTRRRAALSELLLPDTHEAARLREVADTFVSARLLTTNEVAGTTVIEVSHEALIREWMRLAYWLDEARDDIHLQHTISEDVVEWEHHGKPDARLYRGSQLREARAWARRNSPSRQEVTFLQASVGHQRRSVVLITAPLLLLVLVSGIALRLFLVPNVPPPTLATTLNESGPGSIQQAIAAAKPGGTITFDPSLKGTIFLRSDSLSITKNLIIRGPGAGILSINGGQSDSNAGLEKVDLDIPKGASVFISGLTFKGSERFSSISNEGTLTLMNCEVSGNKTIAIDNNGTLNLMNSVISHNGSQPTEVGAIDNASGTTSIMNSTISDNAGMDGGGITNYGHLVLANSTVSGNVGDFGGGINSAGVGATITNSTIAGNTAGNGGGIEVDGGLVTLTFDTIYGNSAHQGGGIYHGGRGSKVELKDSIVAGNRAGTDPDFAGTLTTGGYNLIQDTSGVTFDDPGNKHATDLSGIQSSDLHIDPQLGNHGGPTQTEALLPGSPAIDAIPSDICHADGISTDQRGVRRPQGSKCDIGAYEYQPSP